MRKIIVVAAVLLTAAASSSKHDNPSAAKRPVSDTYASVQVKDD